MAEKKRKCNKFSSAERRDHISATLEGLKLTMRQAQSSSTLEIHVNDRGIHICT